MLLIVFQAFLTSAEDKSKKPKKGEWSHSPNGNFKYSKANLKKILRNEVSQKLL